MIFLEAIAAAGFGYLILGEPVTWVQALGGLAILAGIFVARAGSAGDGGAAVDHDRPAAHEGARLRGQEHRRAGDLVRLPDAL